MGKKKILVVVMFIFIFNFSFTFAEDFGYNLLDVPTNVTNIYQNITVNSTTTNSSDYWITDIGAADTINATQFNLVGDTLTIDESWLTNFLNSWFSGKDTDDLAEGSINFYDNRSFNQSLTDSLYSNVTATLSTEFNEYMTSSRMSVVVENLSESDLEVVNEIVQAGEHYVYGGFLA